MYTGAPAGTNVRFSAVFHEDGDVEYRYGSLFFGDSDHDLGANATIGIGQPGRPTRTVEVLSHAASIADNQRIYLGRVSVADPVFRERRQECAVEQGVTHRVNGPV